MNGIKKPKLAKHIYFFLRINVNDIIDNAIIKIELAIEREMKNTNTKH